MDVLPFYKFHGAGNDFIIIEDKDRVLETRLSPGQIRNWCERRYGVGADGLMLLQGHHTADFKMVYYNSDGRASTMCGNGGRCIARFAYEKGLVSERMNFMAIDGLHDATIRNNQVHLGMQDVLRPERYKEGWVLNTGSPHYVELVDSFPTDLIRKAHEIRYDDRYLDKGINVNYVVESAEGLAIRTYERGVEAETHACGTGITAAAIVNMMLKKDNNNTVPVRALGGELSVSAIKNDQNNYTDVVLVGPAVSVYQGTLEF